MKALVGNPKSEIRVPKEGRSSKAEWLPTGVDSAGWHWGDVHEPGAFELREETALEPPSPPDLLERTARFGEAVVALAKRVPQNPVTKRLIEQLVGAGTSVGANYCEADDSVSKRDGRNRIGTCRKESKETMFFLRMTAAAVPELAGEARRLWREARELNSIFGAIWRKLG